MTSVPPLKRRRWSSICTKSSKMTHLSDIQLEFQGRGALRMVFCGDSRGESGELSGEWLSTMENESVSGEGHR